MTHTILLDPKEEAFFKFFLQSIKVENPDLRTYCIDDKGFFETYKDEIEMLNENCIIHCRPKNLLVTFRFTWTIPGTVLADQYGYTAVTPTTTESKMLND